jgi:predicted dehydrogenase
MHLPNLKSHPHAHIAAICGRNRVRAQEMADKYGIPAVYTDYHEMLEQANLDAVVITVPDALHFEMAMEALGAGLHVLCEKALALNGQQARAMAEKAEAAGVKHMTFFTNRWEPAYRYLRQLVAEGYIGRPYLCQLRYLGGYGRNGRYGWRFDAQHGTGILGDLGSHMIDLAHWLVGDIRRVSAKIATLVEHAGPDGQALSTPANDSALLTLEFVNGACGTIAVSAVTHLAERGQHQQLSLYGEAGTLEVDFTFLDTQIRGARKDQTQFEAMTIPDEFWTGVDRSLPFFDQVFMAFQTQPIGDRQFIDAILANQPVSPDFSDGLKVQEVIDAAFESHRRGGWVAVGASDENKEKTI